VRSERIDFGFRRKRPSLEAAFARFFELFVEFLEPKRVGAARLRVKYLSSIVLSDRAQAEIGHLAAGNELGWGRRRIGQSHQVQRMNLLSWIAQQMSDLTEPLGIGETSQLVTAGESPVLSFAREEASYCMRTSRRRHGVTTSSLMVASI
jgi:hypothetical protein